ncbi:GNAT family N-acetyltransferase [Loktanella sp. F6476L]|uniref:GNAT family N-acetyltransferase n=1 Tax=Loktanella sp. F6476L TaxID=2926405 RepID=UPI001FF58B64|nr:GNAT family N-acetyltransferase [Loktanella sp. F6476L]MCK0122119.1 GNAT family N-acetyltransferase [Loktanella sp. F6476L]
MPKGYDIRPWRSGDEIHIRNLFKDSFGRELSADFWKWRYLDHPHGGPLVMLAWSGDDLVAHYGASQAPFLINSEIMPAALSMSTMTHPKHRGRGLVEAVGEALYEDLRQASYAAVWGFPNPMINATRQRKLGWEPVCDVATLSLATKSVAHTATESLPAVEKVPAIDARFENLNNRLANSTGLQSLKDEKTLKWRIDVNPVNTYTRYIITDRSDISAYAITKNYGIAETDIVDLQAIDERHTKALLHSICSDAQNAGIERLNTWCLNKGGPRLALERFGFSANSPVTYLGGRQFNSAVGDFTDARRWSLAMLDSDLY